MDNQAGGGSSQVPHGDHAQKPETAKGGKGKERMADDTLVDRLQSSGRMALNTVAGSQPSPARSSNDKASSAAGALSGRGHKSVSESVLAEASTSRHNHGIGETLRSDAPNSKETPAQFDSFFNATPNLQETLEPVSGIQPAQSSQARGEAFREQAVIDGSDVVQLLDMLDEEPKYEEYDETLSAHEATRLQQALFTGGSSQPAWDRLLNFNPDFSLNPDKHHDAQLHTGTTDTLLANDIWLQQWDDVLSSYTDEVWGDLGTLVHKAQREIRQIQNIESHADTRDPETKALERLRQILSHVRGH